eukprot:7019337-Lingulodinium_polyedra.AAC.1
MGRPKTPLFPTCPTLSAFLQRPMAKSANLHPMGSLVWPSAQVLVGPIAYNPIQCEYTLIHSNSI